MALENYLIQVKSSSSGYFEGYNLFVLEKRDVSNYTPLEKKLLITNMQGDVVKKLDLGKQGALADFSAEFINSTTILFGNQSGANLWNIYTNQTQSLSYWGHHEYEFNPYNNTFFTFNAFIMEHNDEKYLIDTIDEFDFKDNKVWSFNLTKFISIDQWCPFHDMEGDVRDLTHANSIFYDGEQDVLYVNVRNVNTFYKINHKTGELIWALGEYGNFTLYDYNGKERESLFWHTHALEYLGNNTFIIFDNGLHNQDNPLLQQSSIKEITINEDNMTANITWQWIAPEDYYSSFGGDADRLPNGDRIGCFGTAQHPNSKYGARLVEVDFSGNVVWELDFEREGDISYGIYRIERVRFTPYIQPINDIWFKPNSEVILNLSIFYKFRNKYPMPGFYKLILDNTEIDTGTIFFERFWQSTILSLNFGVLSEGKHNATVLVSDEDNHWSKAQFQIVISSINPFETDTQETHSAFFEVMVLFTILQISYCKTKRKPIKH
ncbi:MAG: aryl-sulfate sulfotransferase [Candidatus Heimdallarchaeaceae archaeon]